ncbi:MAG TPA: transcriptional repressor [Candidatus Mailhella merdavium]|nr:transcriptional repressor [Candidatus Mailhella merdavium]
MPQPQTRMTRQRMLILEELRSMCSHPTAEELYSRVRTRMPHISLSTVYRNLELLASAKEILRLDSAGTIRRFDGNITPHRHIQCTRCGKVVDLPADCCSTPDLSKINVEGFSVTGVRVEFEGLCDECRLTQ